jgi:hypothetical protein
VLNDDDDAKVFEGAYEISFECRPRKKSRVCVGKFQISFHFAGQKKSLNFHDAHHNNNFLYNLCEIILPFSFSELSCQSHDDEAV